MKTQYSRQYWRCLAGLMAVSALSPFSAQAETLVSEPFDYTAGRLDEISLAAGNGLEQLSAHNPGLYTIVAENLDYGDLGSSGNAFDVEGGGTTGWMIFDTSPEGPLSAHLNPGGYIGADGSTLYLAFLVQYPDGLADPTFGQFDIRIGRDLVYDGTTDSTITTQVLRMGRNWANPNFFIGATSNTIGAIDDAVHLVVARFDFVAGDDTVTVYWDPDISADPSTWSAAQTQTGDLSFDAMWIKGQESAPTTIVMDEFRIGTDVASVIPEGPPAAPTGLNASPISSSQIDLAWTDNSQSETGYSIERSTEMDTGFAEVASVGTDVTAYSDTDSLSAATTYYYRVAATGTGLSSEYSNVASATTLPEGVSLPAAPTNIAAAIQSESSALITWNDESDDETGFRVFRARSINGPYQEIGTAVANAENVLVTGLAPETTYYFKVLSFNSNGFSLDSTIAEASTDTAPSVGPDWVWIEAEDFDSTTTPGSATWLNPDSDELREVVSGDNGFGYGLSQTEIDNGWSHQITYTIEIPVDGTYALYARRTWSYSKFAWSVDGGDVIPVGADVQRLEDVAYREFWPLSWVEGGQIVLTAGQHTFTVHLDSTIFPFERASDQYYFFDAFILSQSPFVPAGNLKPGSKLDLFGEGMWAFEPDSDVFTDDAMLDLRYLNEDNAGDHGFISYQSDRFVRGDGTPIRFWGASLSNHGASYESMRKQAEFLAKRGVNIVRYHSSLFQNSAATMDATDLSKVDDIHRTVAAFKESGIYTKVSHYFVLGLRIQPEWGIDGYTTEWLAGRDRAPFGNMFWSEQMTDAFKQWMRDIYDRENPYNGIRLADDPAMAIVELQNEDNMFFFTLVTDELPPIQLQRLEGLFHDFVVEKYGSLEDAYNAWGGEVVKPRDDLETGTLQVYSAGQLTVLDNADTPAGARMGDLIEFYGKLQYDWFADIKQWMIDEIGIKCTFVATNWKTARPNILRDLELYTYTAAGVLDLHNYFNVGESQAQVNYQVRVNDAFANKPGVHFPDTISMVYEQVRGHPSFVSEFTWVNPTLFSPEAALLTAGVASMNDVDGFTWFAYGSLAFEQNMQKWPVGAPPIMGQFPGAALLYRRGDTQLAPVVVAEGRTLQSVYDREPSIITQSVGFDPVRDTGYDPETGEGLVDSLAFVVGKVEVNYETDDDVVATNVLAESIDRDGQTVTSATDELFFDYGNGLYTISTTRSQGMTGFAAEVGPVELPNVVFDIQNDFVGALAIALDDRPLAHSEAILLQVAADAKPYNWTMEAASVNGEPGYRILDLGRPPMNMHLIEGQVTLKGVTAAMNPTVTVLDENGYPVGTTITEVTEAGLVITLPRDALYTHVSLEREPGFFDDFAVYAGSWYFAEWFGWVRDEGLDAGWVQHLNHGWIFLAGDTPAGFWAYHLDFGWVYHAQSAAPWMYVYNDTEYVYYLQGTDRWFWSQSQGWFTGP